MMQPSLLASDDLDQVRTFASDMLKKNEVLKAEKELLKEQKERLEAEKKALRDETEVYLQRISELTRKLAAATNRGEQLALDLELQVLRQRLAERNSDTFGSRSERRKQKSKAESKAKKKRDRAGPTAQPDLPYEEVIHLLDKADCMCPRCGEDLRVMANQFEESELVVAVERTYKVEKHKRQKYNCGHCGHIDTALGPLKLIVGGRYDLSFVIQVAMDKYLSHLPLERQVQRMRRRGLRVTTQTLWDQLSALYVVLLPVYLAIHKEVLQSPVLHADETTWRMMGKGRSRKWWMWSLVTEEAAYYAIESSRGHQVAKQLFKAYDGIVVADGYSAYKTLEQARTRAGGEQLGLDGASQVLPDYRLAICWMHARRPLFKAEKHSPEVGDALDWIAELYAIESEAKAEAGGDPVRLRQARERLREEKSRVIIERLRTWWEQQRPLPRSGFAKAITFLENHWTGLLRFLEDGRVPLDNGAAERALRGPVVGRKNHYGSRSERGARVSALLYTIMESCKRAQVDPETYLMFILKRVLGKSGPVLTPLAYAKSMKYEGQNE